jgi:ionotropic glutamate receptor
MSLPKLHIRIWKDLSLNDDLDEDERAKLAVWDYPISDRFTKIWASMTEATAHVGYNEAIHKVKSSPSDSKEGNALVGK